MIRKNEDRFGPKNNGSDENVSPESLLQFVTPTEFVALPSKGVGYAPNHPLHGQDTVEIKYMTAKDEDILTSRSLIKNGVVLDRLISNLLVDKKINSADILLGDRNAIVIAARASAYGHIYETKIECPNCGAKAKTDFDLTDPWVYSGDDWSDYDITALETGNYVIKLPKTGYSVEVRLLKGTDEIKVFKLLQNKKKSDEVVTRQMRMFIVSIEGHTDSKVIEYFINNAPSSETRYLRQAYDKISPDLKIKKDYECDECGHEANLEVGLGADFFWPDR